MEIKEIEVYSEASNSDIVRMPGRRFPGCVIQGDSLSNLLCNAELVCSIAERSGDEELIDAAAEVRDALLGRLAHYERVLGEHGISLPYNRPSRS
ncbi:DUF6959 family protein [Lacipirellula sp.]|uniref:DUF6959 family protein n=1 Tax=Lacipirellula sp. TaxID=2691419 RepID=UPI003D11CC6F